MSIIIMIIVPGRLYYGRPDNNNNTGIIIPYSRKIKFGGLAVYTTTTKLKSYSQIIRMAILYRTVKFKSANILPIAILGIPANISGYTVLINIVLTCRLFVIPF